MAFCQYGLVSDATIGRICRIARDLRRPSAPSLDDLVDASGYRAIRSELSIATLAQYICTEPRLIEDWLGYCGDKRTSGGWAFGRDDDGEWTVWQPFPKDGAPKERRHSRAETACADYVLAELDYWVGVGD